MATTEPAPSAIIRTERLSKTFSIGGIQQHILRNLDLAIGAGEFTVVMGPSGAGKSTLLYALSGMDRPTLGRVLFAGSDLSGLTEDGLARFRRTHSGFVFQQVHLLDGMSLMDNVMAAGLLTSRPRAELRRRAGELFTLVGLPEETTRRPATAVSGGEAQRAAIVRALVNDPDVVFADEPTGQLNSQTSTGVLDVLGRVNDRGQTILMVTHDLRAALRGSRILYLRDGRIQGELTLGPYAAAAPPDAEERLRRLAGFLDELGW
jgi:putative ABC transport system ATP-binding protein